MTYCDYRKLTRLHTVTFVYISTHFKTDIMLTEEGQARKNVGKLFRSAVFWTQFQKKKETVRSPVVATYLEQIQQCQDMYDRLRLDSVGSETSNDKTPFPLLRGHTMINQSRPLTYSLRKSAKTIRPYSIRSAPAFTFQDHRKTDHDTNNGRNDTTDNVANSEIQSENEFDTFGNRKRMDPEQLSEHLRQNGFGLPEVVKSTSTYQMITKCPPRGMRSRSLPRNPSKREKIKGRARLDQEMANMKALAFCEQQAPKVFRTASANMKNRDVQFMEEDFKEHMHMEGMDDLIDDIGDDNDNASIVRMPVKQEELFTRINTWVEEVESTCKVYHPPETNVSVSG